KTGMPVIVFERDFASDGFAYRSIPPDLTAKEFIVADIKNNFVFLEKSGKDKVPIASVTKIMTALIAGEFINLENDITIPKSAAVYTSKPRLKAGESYSAYNLLYPLLLESSNEAAETFSSHLGKERFVNLMNNKARAIGMNSTSFADSSGSGEGNVSTAEDLFSLAKYVYNNRSFIFGMASGKLTSSAYGKPSFDNLSNLNIFGDREDFIGGKMGKTAAAGETMVAVFELNLNEDKRPIAIVMLGSSNVQSDILKVVDWLNNNY
ncbi:MAG: serine hydrolase, partial [Candidatus Colwellbacteria bacterium]|nr:serine hydrolase [Candidatus Colwellbacteria bacterium]